MNTMTRSMLWSLAIVGAALVPLACGSSKSQPKGTGGVPGAGGLTGSGGLSGNGGSYSDGAVPMGGSDAGPAMDSAAGGAITGGAIDGGSASGGAGMGGAQGMGGTGGSGTGGSTSTPECPGSAGPAMVKLPAGYCIDSTEVTRSQYEAWLKGSPPTANQIAGCQWNSTFAPEAACMGTAQDPKYVCLEACDHHPQVCVDWCDAAAYCLAAGKRLCGKIGGGANPPDDFKTATASEWHNACTSQGQNSYPYGSTYDGMACNGSNLWEPRSSPPYDYKTVPVASLSTCQSSVAGYAGVYDLSGSVDEWEDSCTGQAGGSDSCRVRGGAFSSASNHLLCAGNTLMNRNVADATIGFRCCSSR